MTLLCSKNKFWLCIGKVNGLKIDGKSVDYISHDMLFEDTATVSYQMLGLQFATLDNDPEGRHDWRTYAMEEQSFTVPGHLIQPVNVRGTPLRYMRHRLRSHALPLMNADEC